MKNYVSKLLLMFCGVIMAFIVVGCGKNYSDEIIETKAEQDKFPEFAYDISENPYYQKDNHMIAIAENGYYFARNIFVGRDFDNLRKGNYSRVESYYSNAISDLKPYGKLIYYYDINTEKVTPLCSKADCKHNTVQCEAYFANVENGRDGGFVYYNHRLYMVGYDGNSGIKLLSYDEHGKNQTNECTIWEDPNYTPYVNGDNDLCILNDNVYSWGIKNDSSDKEIQYEIVLFQTKMSEGKTDKILTFRQTAEQFQYTKDFLCDLEVANNKLYVKTCSIDNDIFSYTLYELEQGTQELKEILKTNAPIDCDKRIDGEFYASIKGFCVDNDGNIYYVDEISNQGLNLKVNLCKFNTATKNIDIIYEIDNLIGYNLMCDNENIYFNNGGSSISSLIIMDKDGKEKYVKEYTDSCDLVGIDDRYLIVRVGLDCNLLPNDNTRLDTCKLAVLGKNTIGTGNEEWKQMYNGMFMQ